MITKPEAWALLKDQFPQPFVLWRRLYRLHHAGYLTRPPEQQWRLRKRPGSSDHVYALGTRGAKELERIGFKLPRKDWDQKAKDFKPYSFEHPLLITKFLTCMSLGVQRTPGIRILELFPEGKFREEVNFFDGQEDVSLTVIPDSTLVCEDSRGNQTERLGIFLEAQRRTMPLSRTTFKQSSFHKKLLAYRHLWQQPDRIRERLRVDDFIVLTVCEDEASAVLLRDFTRKVDGEENEEKGTNIFWFATQDALSLDDPQAVLLSDIWTTAAGERGSIF